jgi:hypothetical protein
MRTYLKYYRPKPVPEEEVPRPHKSPAAKKPTPEQAEAARRRAERNKPMGCGMKLFLFYLAASALTALALFVAEQFKR